MAYLDLRDILPPPMQETGGGGFNGRQVEPRAVRMLQAALLPVGHPERRDILASLMNRDLDPPEPDTSPPLGVDATNERLLHAQGTLTSLLRELRTLQRSSTVPGTETLVRVMVMALEGFDREIKGFRETMFEPDE